MHHAPTAVRPAGREGLTVRGVKMTEDGIRLVGPDGREPAEGTVRVTVSSSGICGSDLHMAAMGPSWAILGHEFAGRPRRRHPGGRAAGGPLRHL